MTVIANYISWNRL